MSIEAYNKKHGHKLVKWTKELVCVAKQARDYEIASRRPLDIDFRQDYIDSRKDSLNETKLISLLGISEKTISDIKAELAESNSNPSEEDVAKWKTFRINQHRKHCIDMYKVKMNHIHAMNKIRLTWDLQEEFFDESHAICSLTALKQFAKEIHKRYETKYQIKLPVPSITGRVEILKQTRSLLP